MTTYRLLVDLDHGKHTTEQTVTASCIHRDGDFVRFHDADHGLVYAVQRGLLLAIETLPDASDPDQDACATAEPGPDEPVSERVLLEMNSVDLEAFFARAKAAGRPPRLIGPFLR